MLTRGESLHEAARANARLAAICFAHCLLDKRTGKRLIFPGAGKSRRFGPRAALVSRTRL